MSYNITTSWHFFLITSTTMNIFPKEFIATYYRKIQSKISIRYIKSSWRNMGYNGENWLYGFLLSQMLWSLSIEIFLNNFQYFVFWYNNLFNPYRRKCYVKFQVHISAWRKINRINLFEYFLIKWTTFKI